MACRFLSLQLLLQPTSRTGEKKKERKGGGAEGGECRGRGGGQSWDTELFKTPLEIGRAHVSAPQRALDVLLKEPSVCLEDFCCLLIQRILRVRLLQGGGRGRRQ